MRPGLICSAGGTTLFSALQMAVAEGLVRAEDVTLITDRACGAEDLAARTGVRAHRITAPARAAFSAEAADFLSARSCTLVLMAFARLVSPDLHARLPTLNLHPSLLPGLPGFGALQAVERLGLPMLGATLHLATTLADGGPVVAQAISPCLRATGQADGQAALARLSYLQKTYLALCALEMAATGALQIDPVAGTFHRGTKAMRITPSAAPALQDQRLIARFTAFRDSCGIDAETFVP